MLEEKLLQAGADHRFHGALDFRGNQLVLCLRREFRVRQLDREHGGCSFPGVIPGRGNLLLAPDALAFHVGIQRTGHGCPESRQMRATVTLRYVVGVTKRSFLVAVAPLQRQLHLHVTAGFAEVKHRRVDGSLVPIQVVDKRPDSALEVENLVASIAFVPQVDLYPRVQERKLPETLRQNVIVEFDVGKNRPTGFETYDRPGLARIGANLAQGACRFAQVIDLLIDLPASVNLQNQLVGQRIDHRHTDAVQAAGYLVGIVVELPAGMQDRHDDFGRRAAFFRVNIHRDAAPVVRDRDGFVRVNRYSDAVAETGQGLVDRIVNDLKDHMMQTRAVIRVTDVHARTFADCFQPA